jgi:hypothetical protein
VNSLGIRNSFVNGESWWKWPSSSITKPPHREQKFGFLPKPHLPRFSPTSLCYAPLFEIESFSNSNSNPDTKTILASWKPSDLDRNDKMIYCSSLLMARQKKSRPIDY